MIKQLDNWVLGDIKEDIIDRSNIRSNLTGTVIYRTYIYTNNIDYLDTRTLYLTNDGCWIIERDNMKDEYCNIDYNLMKNIIENLDKFNFVERK